MSVVICSLNSGSNGNCYYVGNDEDAILVDAGISCREIERRMQTTGLQLNKIRAIFISHEHSDHITGLRVLSKKYRIPVFITEQTLRYSQLALDHQLVYSFQAGSIIEVGSLKISAFTKQHDACDPHSFIIEYGNTTVGVFTDIGAVCGNLVYHFKRCHAAFLEANYDEEMLDNGRYPYHLKRRIKGGQGHLSNTQALKLCLDHRPRHMSHLLLSHLSKENNCPDLVRNLFERNISDIEIIVASRYEASNVYTISPGLTTEIKKSPRAAQLSLFS